MKRKDGVWTRGVLWLLAGMICWCCAISALAYRQSLWDDRRVSYRQEKADISAQDLRDLREEIEGGRVAGWTQQLSQSVSVAETGGSVQADVLWCDGDAALVWNLTPVSGHLPVTGDNLGCALDEATARKLFGSTDVVDKELRLGGNTLIVRGVFALPTGASSMGTDPGRGLVLAPLAAATEGVSLTALEFVVYDETSLPALEQAKEWMQTAGLSSAGTWDSHEDERNLLAFIADLPAYLLVVMAGIELAAAALELSRAGARAWRGLREDRLTPAGKYQSLALLWGGGLLVLLGAAGLVLSLAPPLRSIPPSYLPTSWADFAFWPELLTQSMQERAQQAFSIALRPDLVWNVLQHWTIGLFFASLFGLLHGRNLLARNADAVQPFTAALWLVALPVTLPVALFLAARAGWVPQANTAVWLLPSLLYGLIVLLRVSAPYHRWIAWGQKGPVSIRLPNALIHRKELHP